MNRKLRMRDAKNTAQLTFLKLLPLLFMILLYMIASTMGVAATGPYKPGMD